MKFNQMTYPFLRSKVSLRCINLKYESPDTGCVHANFSYYSKMSYFPTLANWINIIK